MLLAVPVTSSTKGSKASGDLKLNLVISRRKSREPNELILLRQFMAVERNQVSNVLTSAVNCQMLYIVISIPNNANHHHCQGESFHFHIQFYISNKVFDEIIAFVDNNAANRASVTEP